MTVRIAGIGTCVPETVVTNDDLSKIVDTSDEWIKSRTGIETRYISKNEETSDLAAEASRKADRPVASDYIHALFEDFLEFHGDRYYKDDGAIIGGIASFHGMPVTVIGQEKGRNTKENIIRNFGMPSPEGFASILWKDSKRADEAAKVMKITAGELKELDIIERVIPEETPVCKENLFEITGVMEQTMEFFLTGGDIPLQRRS